MVLWEWLTPLLVMGLALGTLRARGPESRRKGASHVMPSQMLRTTPGAPSPLEPRRTRPAGNPVPGRRTGWPARLVTVRGVPARRRGIVAHSCLVGLVTACVLVWAPAAGVAAQRRPGPGGRR